MRTQLSTPPALVERTTLPRIFVRTKGTVKYHGHVSGYIAGPATRIQGINVVPLYYLSLVGMRGEGTTLQGIFSALTSTNPQDIYLEGVGTVLIQLAGLLHPLELLPGGDGRSGPARGHRVEPVDDV